MAKKVIKDKTSEDESIHIENSKKLFEFLEQLSS
jgi:hypothetical protein